jgi:hypothetical protein
MLCPCPELAGGDALGVIRGIIEDTKYSVGKEAGDGGCHASEPGHEEADRVLGEKVKRGANSLRGVSPGVIVIQHVDQDDAE